MFPLWLRRGVALGAALAFALTAGAIERRKEQFSQEPSYLFLPLPYSLPGIGEGIFASAFGGNVFDTYTDAYAILILGDAQGQILGLEDVHLIERRLIAYLFFLDISRGQTANYRLRGMDTRRDEYNLVEVDRYGNVEGTLLSTFWDRRIEVALTGRRETQRTVRLREPDGDIIAEFEPGISGESNTLTLGALLDYTDDRQDPRRGVRLHASVSDHPRQKPTEPDFYTVDYVATAYLPVGAIHTLALHALRSDAHVRDPGDTSLASILGELGVNCAPGDALCVKSVQSLIENTRAERRNGTSANLGGDRLLRAYPISRFRGAHTLYYSAEFRWNLTEEFTPFNYLFWKDTRTGVQAALFYETGSVSETGDRLGHDWRWDWGAGLRMVTASGVVYRIDNAQGDEGGQTTIMVSYPW